jgi:hypothetical protein
VDLRKIQVWLRCAYQTSAGTDRNVAVRIPQRRFHEWLAENDLNVCDVVWQCQQNGWIGCCLAGQRVDLNARHYGLAAYYDIQPKVFEATRNGARPNKNDARDAYVYSEWNKGTPHPKILEHIRKKGWSRVSSWEALYKIAKRYAQRKGLPTPKPRRI